MPGRPGTSSSHNATDPSGDRSDESRAGAEIPGNAVAGSPDSYAQSSRRQ